MKPLKVIQGRGAQFNPVNPYDPGRYLETEEEDDDDKVARTVFLEVHPKTIVNKVSSPDVRMNWSMNPYQGCEHGCIYCYARPTHQYWGYSAGIEFEQRILVKPTAPLLLAKQLMSKNWRPAPVVLSGNTDCYQPAERRYKLTRQCLEVFLEYRNPVGIITKNVLLLRDLDLLRSLAGQRLVHVFVSLTTLREDLRRKLEPRTATAARKLDMIRTLTENGIPVAVMMAPVIPGLTDSEILSVCEATSRAGALMISHQVVRLNGPIGPLFEDWLDRHYPESKDRVIHQIKSCHGGELNDSRWGERMKGDGNLADMIRQQFQLGRKRFFAGRTLPDYDLTVFRRPAPGGQLSLF